MTTETQSEKRPVSKLFVFVPLAIFLALAGIFLMQLLSGRDVSTVPSALIGEQAPETSLPPLPDLDLPGLESADFKGKLTLVNVWASWCAPCREEHPVLMALAEDKRFAIAGLNYKDQAQNARRFLGDLGNPYAAIGVDEAGRTAIDWGVYGVPETFLVGRNGKILFKHVGPLTVDAAKRTLLPEIQKALAASQ